MAATGMDTQSEVPQATEHGVGQKPWDSLLGTSIVLVNSVNNQALTIDLNNKERIHGYPKHSGKNQQWELSQFGAGFSIRSLLSSSNGEEGLYLSLGDWGGSSEPVVLSPFPVAWDIRVAGDPTQDVPAHASIIWCQKGVEFEPSDGNDGGDKIALRTPGSQRQLWECHRVTANHDIKESSSRRS